MKAVMISIQPKWVEKIVNGEKTIEVRKSRPKIETPFKCYIYRTTKKVDEIVEEYDSNFKLLRRKKTLKMFSGKVIGEFVCDRITNISVVVRNCNENYNEVYHNDECKGSCLTWKELQEYGKDKPLYGWHISDLKIYDKPKELNEFVKAYPIKCGKGYESIDCTGCGSEFTCAKRFITRPPQSWCYVEDLGEEE